MKAKKPYINVDDWNANNPVGTKCIVTYDDGTEHPHVTRSIAWRLGWGKGHPVVMIDGIKGGYSLYRIRK